MSVAKQTVLTIPEWFIPVWEEFERVVTQPGKVSPPVITDDGWMEVQPPRKKHSKSEIIRLLIWSHVLERRKGKKGFYKEIEIDLYNMKLLEKARSGDFNSLVKINLKYSLEDSQDFFYYFYETYYENGLEYLYGGQTNQKTGEKLRKMRRGEDPIKKPELEQLSEISLEELRSHEIYEKMPIKIEDIGKYDGGGFYFL
jgi:hypothetical protein